MSYLLRLLQCRPLVTDNTSYKMGIYQCYVKESKKLILGPHLHPDQLQNLTTSTGSPLAHAYHVWSTSVSAFMSYHIQEERMNGGTIT